jgi:hypothetical protein
MNVIINNNLIMTFVILERGLNNVPSHELVVLSAVKENGVCSAVCCPRENLSDTLVVVLARYQSFLETGDIVQIMEPYEEMILNGGSQRVLFCRRYFVKR